MRIDIHVHTRHSGHSILKVEDIARIAAKRGLHALAITDHNKLDGARALSKIFPTIIGEEVSSDEGDIIGLFLTERISRGPAKTVIDEIRSQGGLVMVPHPFDSLRKEALGDEGLCAMADLIEVFNGRVVRKRDNERARAFAEKHGIAAVVGSDAHTSVEIGRCWMELDTVDDPKSFMKCVRSAKSHAASSPAFVHIQSKILKAWEALL